MTKGFSFCLVQSGTLAHPVLGFKPGAPTYKHVLHSLEPLPGGLYDKNFVLWSLH